MGNILDYLDWRGDLTFEQSPFNEVDNLILACFSYLDLDEMAEVKNGNTLSVEELFAAFSRREMKKDLKKWPVRRDSGNVQEESLSMKSFPVRLSSLRQ